MSIPNWGAVCGIAGVTPLTPTVRQRHAERRLAIILP